MKLFGINLKQKWIQELISNSVWHHEIEFSYFNGETQSIWDSLKEYHVVCEVSCRHKIVDQEFLNSWILTEIHFSARTTNKIRLNLLFSLRKTLGKVSPILVTLTLRIDSDVESSNVSLKENKSDSVNPNSNDIDYYVRKDEGKIPWFSAECI